MNHAQGPTDQTEPTVPRSVLEQTVAALEAHCSGVRRIGCTMCHDSTWDHECNDREELCPVCSSALSAARKALEET